MLFVTFAALKLTVPATDAAMTPLTSRIPVTALVLYAADRVSSAVTVSVLYAVIPDVGPFIVIVRREGAAGPEIETFPPPDTPVVIRFNVKPQTSPLAVGKVSPVIAAAVPPVEFANA